MFYAIRHMTRYRYSAPVTESVMELRKQPRSETLQALLSFEVTILPKATAIPFNDFLGNVVHTFDIPGTHRAMTITAKSLVEMRELDLAPAALPLSSWDELAAIERNGDQWDWLAFSQMTTPTELLQALVADLGLPATRQEAHQQDPLTLVQMVNQRIYEAFTYSPNTTKVDSPIDDALKIRQGVCQDFTHILLALVRGWGIPARYVSGYISRRSGTERAAEDATHAWVEVYLPSLGWVGFDPTNNSQAGYGHLRVAVGRDYRDVPPTRGTFKGKAESHLDVAVQVIKLENPGEFPSFDSVTFTAPKWSPLPEDPIENAAAYTRFQQSQQQQQQKK